jgi:D-xylose transport system permease protein
MTAVSTPTAPSQPAPAPAPAGEYVRNYFRRLRGGEMGALPAIVMLVGLGIGFTIARPVFLTPGNLANLLPQAAAVTVIAMGLIFVLLLGEIDLSAGFTSGVCAAILAIALSDFNLPWYAALLISTLTGTIIGTFLGTFVAKVGIPSFVVTLAAFLAFQGVVLALVRGGQIVGITDPVILAVGNKNVAPTLGWALYAVSIGAYATLQFTRRAIRQRRGLATDPVSILLIRIGALAVLAGVAVAFLNQERSRNPLIVSLKGLPMVVPIVLVLFVLLTFVLRRTRYGLHIYAVGGNTEAARRAGINVDRIRISAFAISSTLASIGGLIAASRANSVDANTGGSNVLLYAVGAAVIGGTSLFGGKGRILDAVLGGLVVAVIENGMGLVGLGEAWVKYVVTGVVLLGAATLDALSRRRAASAGLR